MPVMSYLKLFIAIVVFSAIAAVTPAAHAQAFCEEQVKLDDESLDCYRLGPPEPPISFKAYVAPAVPKPDSPLMARLRRYGQLAMGHRLSGLASYYSASLDGTLTANGERYHKHELSAAHLTLPLGSWIEVTSRATGRKIRLRVNDRGPYVRKFVLDLSQAAAHVLGVDYAADRRVDIRVIALPGEEPLPDDADAPKQTTDASSSTR
jgi:rare lipoprotein A